MELEDAYGGDGMAVLDCRGKVHLNQVYLCLEQDEETHLPGAQVYDDWLTCHVLFSLFGLVSVVVRWHGCRVCSM